MKKVILVYGSISGLIFAAMFMITMPLYENGILSMGKGEIVGYSTMAVALSLIFFGVKSYRDRHLQGTIKFGKALLVGLAIAGIASLFYAISWEISFTQFMPDFMDKYAAMGVAKAKASGASEVEIQKTIDGLNRMKEIYKNPILRFAITIAEILPVGILIALISAAILRRKEMLPA